MVFDVNTITKRVQYITVDSEFVTSNNPLVTYCNNNFSVNFGTSYTNTSSVNPVTGATTITGVTTTGSNIYVQEMKNVIGLKLVDFYVTQIGSFESSTSDGVTTLSNTSTLAVKYIDILCPDLPDTAQILDERKSKIFARIPLERDFSGASNIIANDKQWKNFDRQTNYFNPISITKLNFQMFELTGVNTTTNANGKGTYQTLQPDAQFYMILEVTTIDSSITTLPKEDPQLKVVRAIESLEQRFASLFEDLPNMIKAGIPEPVVPEPVVVSVPIVPSTIAHTIIPDEKPPQVVDPVVDIKKMDTKMYIIIALVILFIAYIFSSKK